MLPSVFLLAPGPHPEAMASPFPSTPATVAEPLLVARGLGRQHPEASGWLYQKIELSLLPGGRTALVGPTGSGKSLILRALALLDPIDQGEIRWCGVPIPDPRVPEFRGLVLYLQQRSPVIEGTVEENLTLPFSLRLRQGQSFPRDRVDSLLGILGREPSFLANRTANLSGGERQIVALLRALLVAPTVLLLDEPTAALDPETTSAIERLVASWHAEAADKRAFLWVSHDPHQAQRVADQSLHVDRGRLVSAS